MLNPLSQENISTANNAFLLFPNPVTNELTIRSSNNFNSPTFILIRNTFGQTIIHETIEPNTLQHKINVQSLPNGIYFVEVKNKQGYSVLKFNKQ